MNLFFMGTPEFASASLIAIAREHKVMKAICMPDRAAGRGRKVSPPDVKKVAGELSIPVLQPENLDEITVDFENLKPEAVCVVAYGKIIPSHILSFSPSGFINLHASLLPAYRGAAPINRAVMEGERKTGVTTMLVNDKLDSGDILLQKEIAIKDDEDSEILARRMSAEGAELLLKTLASIEDGSVSPVPQDHSRATYAPMLSKDDGTIDWKQPSGIIRNLIRGTAPWPGAFTKLGGKTLKIIGADFAEGVGKPGEVLNSRKKFMVASGAGALEIREVQIEGRKKMSGADFLLGAKLPAGTVLG
ncbi:MAG: methionyl-tRNA formyltransferase [Candidatus Mycalebacterium zealandia]|nr:MAG: methionyl-tRNA formyltransferase [Candidatus Mycalebacterium zealandia]